MRHAYHPPRCPRTGRTDPAGACRSPGRHATDRLGLGVPAAPDQCRDARCAAYRAPAVTRGTRYPGGLGRTGGLRIMIYAPPAPRPPSSRVRLLPASGWAGPSFVAPRATRGQPAVVGCTSLAVSGAHLLGPAGPTESPCSGSKGGRATASDGSGRGICAARSWMLSRPSLRQPPRHREATTVPTTRVQAFPAHTCNHVPARRMAA